MSACNDEQQQGKAHVARVARNLTMLLAVTGACSGDDVGPSADAQPCVDDHDEDGDGIGDRCDVCPTVADAHQRDTAEAELLQFEDGIGDACDPRPARAGDDVAALHTFEDPADAAAFRGTGWTIANDRATSSSDARWFTTRLENGAGIIAQARFTELAWPNVDAFVEVAVDTDAAGGTGIACRLTASSITLEDGGGARTTETLAAPLDGDVVITTWRVIDPQQRGTMRCDVLHEGQTITLQAPTSDAVSIGTYALAARGASTVTSLLVYSTPPLPGDGKGGGGPLR